MQDIHYMKQNIFHKRVLLDSSSSCESGDEEFWPDL